MRDFIEKKRWGKLCDHGFNLSGNTIDSLSTIQMMLEGFCDDDKERLAALQETFRAFRTARIHLTEIQAQFMEAKND